MSNKAKYLTLASLLLFAVFLLIPSSDQKKSDIAEDELSVTVSFYPIYDIVRNIGGNRVNLKQIVPFGRELHSYEPTPKDMIEIGSSQLFIFNGLVDPWAKSIADSSSKEKINLNLSTAVTVVDEDPHYWLNLDNYGKMVLSVLENMVKVDPKNEQFFRDNAERFLKEVRSLDSEYKSSLGSCQKDTIIVNHDAFNYLSRSYGFKAISVMGLSPDDQPSAKQIAEIIDIINDKKVSTIFFEELVSSAVVDSISSETGAKVESLSPIENVLPEKVDHGFIKLMGDNLLKLQDALECK